jgi:hypothetical protein
MLKCELGTNYDTSLLGCKRQRKGTFFGYGQEEINFIFLIKKSNTFAIFFDMYQRISKTYPAIKFYFFNTKKIKHVPN